MDVLASKIECLVSRIVIARLIGPVDAQRCSKFTLCLRYDLRYKPYATIIIMMLDDGMKLTSRQSREIVFYFFFERLNTYRSLPNIEVIKIFLLVTFHSAVKNRLIHVVVISVAGTFSFQGQD